MDDANGQDRYRKQAHDESVSNVYRQLRDRQDRSRQPQPQAQPQYQPQYQQPRYAPAPSAAPGRKKTSGCLVLFLIIGILFVSGALILALGTINLSKQYIARRDEAVDREEREYITGLDQLTSETEDELYTCSCETYAASLVHGETINSVEYAGCYLLVPRDEDADAHKNYVYIVLHANITYTEDSTWGGNSYVYDYYWYARYCDIALNEDGSNEIVDINDCRIVDHHVESHYAYAWVFDGCGYVTLQELYDSVIAPSETDYNVYTSIGSGDAGEE